MRFSGRYSEESTYFYNSRVCCIELTEQQIGCGSFWYWRPQESFPPKPITYHHEYAGGDRLGILCAQAGMGRQTQKNLVRDWCRALPMMSRVRYDWCVSRVNEPLLETVCTMIQIEDLYIKWGSMKSLDPLLDCKTIRHLRIGRLMTLTKKDIACLCLHDSYICERRHEDLLKEVMEEEYEKVMGFKPVIA